MKRSTIRRTCQLAVPVAAAAMLLSSCATPTPYQPRLQGSRISGGFSEQRIAENRYRVMFAGNSLTSRERVENYLLFRAAELTRQAGYECFAAARRGTDPRVSISHYPGWGGWGGAWGPSWRYGWGGRWSPWGPWGWGYDPFWGGDVDVRVSYEAFAEIVMSRGPCSTDPDAFSAEDVTRTLGPSIRYPENR